MQKGQNSSGKVKHNRYIWNSSVLFLNGFMKIIAHTGGRKCLIWDSCKAHTTKLVTEHIIRRGVLNIVTPGGLTPSVQAGDLGIYKSFKDTICPIISAWKNSDQVKQTTSRNPKPPEKEEVCRWVSQACRQVDQGVIQHFVRVAGLGNWDQWMIWKHHVYGNNFQLLWSNHENLETNKVETQLEALDLDEPDSVLE